jgi:ribosome recycling factor
MCEPCVVQPTEPTREELEAMVRELREEVERLKEEIRRLRRESFEVPPHYL